MVCIPNIYIKNFDNEYRVFFSSNFIKRYKLKPNLIDFLEFFIPIQLQKGIDEWVILKLERTAEKLNIPRPSLSRYLKQLEDANLLIHEDFRSTLWKINLNINIFID
ncbi:hypothetical protein ADU90_06035 (plasmid) [Clostridium botulinum]|uniref:HTH iclR-type domain-containing protein n=1 Tax=Clostridium botulinum C/D str. DC5 TaxID=1443128 RepID=A0A0A0HYW1_CLOBO|nr:hypothetical protein Z955_14630 [Clostridium botulinum C/D str. DC5]KOC56896.1 hypothetical protein ADU89_01495 [Clostridium botulinum]KOC57371.1 hypothetical protein ADU90_06035 [Clostridium botulinum]